jgi:molecular chaperone GrpE
MNTAPEKTRSSGDETSPQTPTQAPETPEQLMQGATTRITELEAKVSQLTAELAETKDRWMRAEAETANVRSRGRRETEETRLYAVQKFATDVAEVAENLRRGLEAIPAPSDGESEIVSRLREGFAGIERNVLAILDRNGIKREDPTGQKFDPNLHQAMAEQESAAHAPGTVMYAWTQGWTLNGRLLRPAMVVVAKAPPEEITSNRGKVDTAA